MHRWDGDRGRMDDGREEPPAEIYTSRKLMPSQPIEHTPFAAVAELESPQVDDELKDLARQHDLALATARARARSNPALRLCRPR